MPALIDTLARTVLLPVMASGALLFIAWRLSRKQPVTTRGPWAAPLALVAGLVLGQGALGAMAWPPMEAIHWLPLLALLATALVLLERGISSPSWAKHGLRLVLFMALPFSLLSPLIEHSWGPVEGFLWVVALGLAGFGLALVFEQVARRSQGFALPLQLVLLATGSSIALVLSGSLLLGQLAGILAASIGVFMVLAFFFPSLSLAGGTMTVFSIQLAGLWMVGYFYAELTATIALILFLAPLAVWLSRATSPVRFVPRFG